MMLQFGFFCFITCVVKVILTGKSIICCLFNKLFAKGKNVKH